MAQMQPASTGSRKFDVIFRCRKFLGAGKNCAIPPGGGGAKKRGLSGGTEITAGVSGAVSEDRDPDDLGATRRGGGPDPSRKVFKRGRPEAIDLV